MYRTYYNFTSMPFEISPDPKFLWLGKKYGEALAAMRYGILASKGFISLTGDVGTGKTTLVNALANRLGDNIIFAKIPDPSLKALDFFNFTAKAFEMNKTFSNKGDFLSHLEVFLNNAYAKGKKVSLIIEEAQRLNPGLLEEIRLFSNIEKPNRKLINILFVGQNEFTDLLKTNKALRHRITVSCRIEPLTETETEKYILHRLKIAGSESRIFSPDAVQEVFAFSEGNPRLINIICDLALLSGYVQETKVIESEIIRECTANVLIPDQKSTGVIKDPKALAKTVQQTRIRELASLRGLDSEVAEKVRTKTARRKAVFMAATFLLILTCIAGYLYYFEGYNTAIGSIKPFLEKTLSRFADHQSETSPAKLQMLKNSNSGSEMTKRSDNQGQQQALLSQANEIPFRRLEIAHLQTQLLDLKAQKTSADSQLSRLKSRNDELVAELKELQATKERVAALENVVKNRDQRLPQLEQKLKELENALDQEKNSNTQMRTDLAAKAALVAELQQTLETSQSNHLKLEDEIEKSRAEILQMQNRLSDLNAQKTFAEDQLSQLKSRNDAMVFEIKELKNSQERLAALETGVEQREQTLTRLEQKLKDMENALNREKKAKDRLETELSSKTARLIDLQQQLEASRSNHNELEDEVARSKYQVEQLQGQLSDLKIKQASAVPPPPTPKMREALPSEGEKSERQAESPNPAAIIDWVLKKKSE